ncbi:MAG: hypothetical protein ACFFB2_19315 [Promethearchaeota archaeon]
MTYPTIDDLFGIFNRKLRIIFHLITHRRQINRNETLKTQEYIND